MNGDASFNYSAYDRIARAHVDDRGRVDYAGVKRDIALLRTFVDRLAETSPENAPDLFPTDDDRKRYYLTAYNALVLYFAAEAYPKRNALWARLGYFKDKDVVLGGRRLTLNELEHGIIRKQFVDPRIHFFLNCGAVSCPPLRARAIADGATEDELEDAARTFVNDPANVRFDPETGTLSLSKIFDWYEEDFVRYLKAARGLERATVADYVALYLDGDAGHALAHSDRPKLRVVHLPYDKGLNDQ